VNNGEEEIASGMEVHRVEEEMEGGEALSLNKTNVSFSKESATKSFASQRKASLLITKEVTKGWKEFAEIAFFNQAEQACALSQNYLFVHAELAKLVVDIECKGP